MKTQFRKLLFGLLASLLAPLAVSAVGAENAPGLSLLIESINDRRFDTVTAMLAANPKLADAADFTGATPTHYAASCGDKRVIQAVLFTRPNVNRADNIGQTPIFRACTATMPDNLQMLIAAGAEVNVVDNIGVSPLLIVSDKGKPQMIEALLQARANANTPDKAGRTPLMASAFQGNPAAIKLLLGAGADLNVVDLKGDTALHYAARNGQRDVIPLLLPLLNVKNQAGQTALNIAGLVADTKFVQEMLKYGAAAN